MSSDPDLWHGADLRYNNGAETAEAAPPPPMPDDVQAAHLGLERCSPSLIPELRSYLTLHREHVESMIRRGDDEAGVAAGLRYAKMFDGLLCSLFQAVHGVVAHSGTWVPIGLAAVGSYGRGAVSFHSDLDVRLLCPENAQELGNVVESLLYPLWDAGLSVGHQIVTAAELIDLAQHDLPTATTLLDWRLVAGDRAGTDHILAQAYEGVFGSATIGGFLAELERKSQERHERYGGSVYLLEPDVKNGAGGLRDLDVIQWAARARWRVRDLRDLVRVGVLVPRELQSISEAASLLWRVRNLLHVHTGRRSDRLSFEYQERLAADLGYGQGGTAVERFMSEYYRHARALTQAHALVLGRAAPPPERRPREKPIAEGLKLSNDRVALTDPAELTRNPALAFSIYDEAVRRGSGVLPVTRDAIARATSSTKFCERLRASPQAAELFVRLVTTVRRTELKDGSVLKELHDVGLLTAMVPEFAPVVGRVHHDVYHVYTVDVHSVAAVDQLRALIRGDLAGEHVLPSSLAAEVTRREVLFFATLLHDVGKDIGGKNHAERGYELCRGILERLGFDDADIADVQQLVRLHLRMYHVATRRDIDDPLTLEEFCREVRGLQALRELYLLTIADVSTTSPTALTSWKARMLEELYLASVRYMSDGPDAATSGRAQAVRRQVLALCPERGENEFLLHYLGALPDRYLYANEAEDIVRHSRFAREAQTHPYRILAMSTKDPYVEIGFVAEDRPGLLAMVTATLTAARLRVVGAQIYSWTDTFGRVRALDLFWVRGSDVAAVYSLMPRIEKDFGRLQSRELAPAELVTGRLNRSSRWSDRPTPQVPTDINIDNRAATGHTVIEVITRDQFGLLFWLSNAIQHAGLTIALAKINTEGNQVADVFYVSDPSGAKLTDPDRIEMLRNQLLSTIARLEGASST